MIGESSLKKVDLHTRAVEKQKQKKKNLIYVTTILSSSDLKQNKTI
jgi:hypothetical protein